VISRFSLRVLADYAALLGASPGAGCPMTLHFLLEPRASRPSPACKILMIAVRRHHHRCRGSSVAQGDCPSAWSPSALGFPQQADPQERR
jgi:hypothetical protein